MAQSTGMVPSHKDSTPEVFGDAPWGKSSSSITSLGTYFSLRDHHPVYNTKEIIPVESPYWSLVTLRTCGYNMGNLHADAAGHGEA